MVVLFLLCSCLNLVLCVLFSPISDRNPNEEATQEAEGRRERSERGASEFGFRSEIGENKTQRTRLRQEQSKKSTTIQK
jgi:hypothetical protein